MKLVLQITAAILLAGLIGWAVYDPADLRHKTVGYSDEEVKAEWEKVDRMQGGVLNGLANEQLEAEIKFVELTHGEAVAATYRTCHTYPPTKKRRQECQRLDEQIVRDKAKRTEQH